MFFRSFLTTVACVFPRSALEAACREAANVDAAVLSADFAALFAAALFPVAFAPAVFGTTAIVALLPFAFVVLSSPV